jgi:anaerobic selenocysteine-containing dehydrogenase
MSDQKQMDQATQVDRRGFLKGSAVFAAAAGLAAAVPASAQEASQEAPKPEPAPEKKADEAKKEEPAPKKNALVDKNGREYRVCDMCGGNMYVADKMWTCEQCGFSYEV